MSTYGIEGSSVHTPAPFIKTEEGKMSTLVLNRRTRVTLTPIANSQRLFCSRVEHRSDDQKPSSDRAFAHSENESAYKEPSKALACSLRTKCDSPDEDVATIPSQVVWSNVQRATTVLTSSISRQETFGGRDSVETQRADNSGRRLSPASCIWSSVKHSIEKSDAELTGS